jgi:hypothetical protein
MEELKPLLGLITFLCIQSAGAIWWASRVTTTLEFVRKLLDGVVEREEEQRKLFERVGRLEDALKHIEESLKRH